MKAVKIVFHIVISLTAAALLVGAPAFYILKSSGNGDVDAISGATAKLPDKPSGEYVLLLNRSLHEDTVDEWTRFFRDGELDVIFDDISCIAAQNDVNAIEMAEILRAQLPENQMKLRTENPVLLASKAENGCIDAAFFSKEIADSLKLRTDADENIICIAIKGGEQEK